MNTSAEADSTYIPVYTELKDPCLTTHLVSEGRPAVTIVSPASGAYDEQASAIAGAIEDLTGVGPPVVSDDAPEAAVPVVGNLIVLGNRSTNRTIEELYNRYFCLLDLRYPGQGGHVVRTLHNPFGNGYNVVFAGGSDAAGVEAAATQLIARLREASSGETAKGALSLGWIADICLSPGYEIPGSMHEFPLWGVSDGYGNTGVFTWTILTKRAALYYMTGDPFHAREFLRLAFPNEEAVREIRDVDKGKVDVTDPLSGLDHYRSHKMILYWDLIEESPVFTDEERLRVTNAFARQLKYRRMEGCYKYSGPAPRVGTRHSQWGGVCVYTVCRYFNRDYPEPVWADGLVRAEWEFASLHDYNWVYGEHDNLFWYNTSMAPLADYLLLSGDRVPIENGVYAKLMRAQEALIPGIPRHRHVHSAALDWWHKAAYLTQDGRWLHYRNLTEVGSQEHPFRLGQSFWPEDHITVSAPEDLVGRWTVDHVPEAQWKTLETPVPLKESFAFMSFRSRPDEKGDYVLLDGFNGQGRNPYHCFAILELRLDGHTVLAGYENQLVVKADGMVEPKVALYAALKDCGVLGDTAFAVGEVPNAGYCNWRRTIAQRVGRYAVVVDRTVFRQANESAEILTKWQSPSAVWDAERNALCVSDAESPATSVICPCDPAMARADSGVVSLIRTLSTREDQEVVSFSLIAPDGSSQASCTRVSDTNAVLQLVGPDGGVETAVVLAGPHDCTDADVAILGSSHLFGLQFTRLGPEPYLISADGPIDADWDFDSGRLTAHVERETEISLALGSGAVRVDGRSVAGRSAGDGLTVFTLPAGQHIFEDARPPEKIRQTIAERQAAANESAVAARREELSATRDASVAEAPALAAGFSAEVGGPIVDTALIDVGGQTFLATASGSHIHVIDLAGKVVQTLETDSDMRAVHWWTEAGLLLAGCIDEKVIAFEFDPTGDSPAGGQRRWAFVSEMAPWLYTHQASHWWKEAGPHHAGIHSLTSLPFLERDGTQAIVGSASTVEILDADGKLLHRAEQVWGDVVNSMLLPRSDGSRDLLSLRRPSLTTRVNILNNRTLDPKVTGFDVVPEGHSDIKSWGGRRYHLFHEDLEGKGTKVVVGDVNGPWDRVGIWNESGEPLFNAPFGAGSLPARSLRDVDVADLNNDGQKQILVGTYHGLVVALDGRCQRIWSTRLESPPTVLKAIAPAPDSPPWIVVGCEDGTVVALDGEGKIIRQGNVEGKPDHILEIARDGIPHAVLTTTSGAIRSLEVRS